RRILSQRNSAIDRLAIAWSFIPTKRSITGILLHSCRALPAGSLSATAKYSMLPKLSAVSIVPFIRL
ncbi:MAG TPA: hypothetical protein VHR47_04105, partial [Bacillota bacterium]|nr:hypothetical protein [Bacillota bacterium]